MKLAGLYKDHDLIFASGVGTPVNPENLVKRSFKPLLKKAGLPEIRFHDLEAYLRHLASEQGRSPQTRPGTLGSRHHSHDPRHLFTLPALNGGSGCGAMGNAFG